MARFREEHCIEPSAGTEPIDMVGRLAPRCALWALRLYRVLLSPVLGQNCRFEPSCSRFAEQAMERHGWREGSVMVARRLLRCHPWGGPGGFDPVP